MSGRSMLELLRRRTSGPVGWEDVITGYDFDLLDEEDVLAWAREQDLHGPEGRAFLAYGIQDQADFQTRLRAACAEATGRVPRIGSRLWTWGQDRWRIALLLDVLEARPGPENLAHLVESIYEMVGCPEDMLRLWRSAVPWEGRPACADAAAVSAFVRRLEGQRFASSAAA